MSAELQAFITIVVIDAVIRLSRGKCPGCINDKLCQLSHDCAQVNNLFNIAAQLKHCYFVGSKRYLLLLDEPAGKDGVVLGGGIC